MRWSIYIWVRVARLGNDIEGYELGRRNNWGTVVHYWIMLFCKTMLMTGCCRVCILQKNIQSTVLAFFLLSTNQQNIAYDNHVLRNRLSMKGNLFKRAVILATFQSCVRGCGHMEDVTHLFVHCNILVIFKSLFMIG